MYIYMYTYIVCYVYNLPSENSDLIYYFFVNSGSLFGRSRTIWQGLWISGNSQCPLIHPSTCPFSLPRTLRSRKVTWWNWYLKWGCKTQNSGLHSKEEKPRDPINQPSRCNTQEGLLSVAQTGDSDLLGGRAPQTANWASFLYAKKPYYPHITYRLQSDWLHVCKVILLAQTSQAFVQT